MEYHVMLGPFQDYTEASIQYGYATMFVAAYPLACIMSFVNNYIGKLRPLFDLFTFPKRVSSNTVVIWKS